ncbi:MFS transporter asaE [Paramyrothecium foliicola]|nr:MFS transporter asaE [Paramyrothecium foliicola]
MSASLERPDAQRIHLEAPELGSQLTPGVVEKGLQTGEAYSKNNRVAPEVIATATDPTLEVPPPDGGVQAWLQVAMGWIVIFATWGYINSFGAFQAYYTSILSQSPSQISWIGSIQTWLTFVIGAFSGRLLDAGFFVPTLVIGSTLQLLGIFLMSISTNYWHLMLTQGVLTGLGSGLFFTPALALISTYFKNRRGLAVGIATTGNSAGGMIYPLVVRAMLPGAGFAWTARTLGFINLLGLALAVVFMRPRLPPRKTGAVIDWNAFKEPLYVCTVIAVFFMVWSVFFTLYYLASFGRDALGMSYGAAAILITLVNGTGLPARILIPLLSDSVGTLNVISVSCVALAIAAFGWLAVHNTVGVYVFTIIYGISNGGYQALIAPAISSITPRMDMAGTRIGMCFTIVSFAGLTGPPVGGFILAASSGNYIWPLLWAALSTAFGAVFMVMARMLRAGWKLKAKY